MGKFNAESQVLLSPLVVILNVFSDSSGVVSFAKWPLFGCRVEELRINDETVEFISKGHRRE